MIRFLAALTTFVLMFHASAFASSDDISFLRLTFNESTMEDSIQALVEIGVRESSIFKEFNVRQFSLFRKEESPKKEYLWVDEAGDVLKLGTGSKVKVAGFPIFGLEMQFMYTVENGIVNRNNPKLSFAEYSFNPLNQHELYYSLKEKLESLYGIATLYDSETTYYNYPKSITSVCSWHGSNNVAIVLSMTWSTEDGVTKVETDRALDNFVYLKYGLENTKNRLSVLEEIFWEQYEIRKKEEQVKEKELITSIEENKEGL